MTRPVLRDCGGEVGADAGSGAVGVPPRVCNEHSLFFFFSSRRRHTRFDCDWSSDVCSSDLHHEANIAPLAMNLHEWIVLAIGFVVSFLVALAVVAWFMNWVRARGFVPFALYRIVLGIGLLILLVRGMV